jgi:pimeloyl-ACP methyl ester carboxylesterase
MARAPDAPWCLDGIPDRWSEAGPVHLAAHSYGGPLAIVVALEHPDLVRSLTLAEPAIGALLTGPLVQAAPPPALSWATVGDVKAPTCSGWSRCPASVRTPSSWPKCSSGMRGSPSPGHGLALLQGAEAGVERIDGEKFGNLVRIDGIRSAATGCLRTPG